MDGRVIVHVVQRPGGNHGARAAGTFFGRLEDQLDGAVELRVILLKHLGQSQTNSGVAVVRAGVHHARIAGGKPVAERAMAVVKRFA